MFTETHLFNSVLLVSIRRTDDKVARDAEPSHDGPGHVSTGDARGCKDKQGAERGDDGGPGRSGQRGHEGEECGGVKTDTTESQVIHSTILRGNECRGNQVTWNRLLLKMEFSVNKAHLNLA